MGGKSTRPDGSPPSERSVFNFNNSFGSLVLRPLKSSGVLGISSSAPFKSALPLLLGFALLPNLSIFSDSVLGSNSRLLNKENTASGEKNPISLLDDFNCVAKTVRNRAIAELSPKTLPDLSSNLPISTSDIELFNCLTQSNDFEAINLELTISAIWNATVSWLAAFPDSSEQVAL
eukprot:NODE_271_length_12205_cov_0.703205.p8 type:complete len:176 gc:universal NODE_271_length_12205_cov_0.703205:8721-9248(+)